MPAVIVSGATGGNVTNILWQQKTPVVTAGSEVAGFPAINVIDPTTWNSWRPATGSNRYVVFDFGEATEIDAVGISSHNLFTSGTNFRVERSTDLSVWTPVATAVPSSNDDIFMLLPSVSYRYYRFVLTAAVANVGVIQIGKRLRFPSSPLDDYVPLNHARQYTKLRNESLKGQLLGNRVIAAGATTDVDQGFMSRTWVDTNVTPFASHYNQGGTFFYASCPAKYPLDMGYCWADGEDSTVNITYTEADKMATVNFNVRSYVAQ